MRSRTRRGSMGRRGSRRGPGVLTSLALFAILCGSIMVFTSFDPKSWDCGAFRNTDEPDSSEMADRASIMRALDYLEDAEDALEVSDYDRSQTLIQKARQALKQIIMADSPQE